MLLHRCVSMGSGWVGGWTDGRTHTSACWQCCELRVMQPPGMLDSRHRVPVPISGPHPIAIPSTRHSAPKHPFVPGCADRQHRASPGPDPPLSSPDPAPPRPGSPPGRYLQALGNGAEQHQVHQPPDPPHAAGTPRPRASVSGGHGRGPRLAPGDRGGGGGRAAPPVRTTAALSARFGSDRLGPARLRPARGGARSSAAARGGGGLEGGERGEGSGGCPVRRRAVRLCSPISRPPAPR